MQIVKTSESKNSEITLAVESQSNSPSVNNPEVNIEAETKSNITFNQDNQSDENKKISERFAEEISGIFKSPEFAYAVLATMYANTCHNDPNKFQNDEALKILEEFAKQTPDHDLSENILKLSKFAKTSKELDRNFSLVADVIRIATGAVALSASIYESTTKIDDSEMTRLNSATEISQIISLATQIIASPITANNGYKASFTGHFTDEMANAFKRIATLIQNKIDGQEIKKSKHNCLDSNHKHHETIFSKRAEHGNDCEHDHEHIPHAGSNERHFGTFLNISSMAMSTSRIASQFQNLAKSNPVLNNLNSSILALTAPVLSIIGKFSSLRAAKIRENDVYEKISTAKKDMSDNFAKIFNKASEASFISPSISIEDAKIALQSELVAIGKKMEEETQERRSESGIKMSAKIWFNYMKDSVYGVSYEAIKFFYDTVPSLWIAGSSVATQLQSTSQIHGDLELQKKDSKLNLKNLDELKKQIESLHLSELDDALTKFLSQIENQSQSLCLDNSCSHDFRDKKTKRRLYTRRAQESIEENFFAQTILQPSPIEASSLTKKDDVKVADDFVERQAGVVSTRSEKYKTSLRNFTKKPLSDIPSEGRS